MLRQSFSGALAATVLLAAPQAFAIGGIKSPYAPKGSAELEYKSEWTHDDRKSDKNSQEHILGFGYAFADRWLAEVELEGKREAGNGGIEPVQLELELKRQLTEKGAYWWDVGINNKYKHTLHSNTADSIESVLLLQNQVNKIRTRANIELEHNFGESGNNLDFEARAWTRYEWMPEFKPGIEWQADFKEIDDMPSWDEQEHYIGPGAYGHIPFLEALTQDDEDEFEYQLVYLVGLTDAAADGAIRFEFEYKFRF